MAPIKKKIQFNILSSDSTNGDGGFGVGTLDLNNITPVIIDVEREDVFIDMEALHGRSRIEKKYVLHQIVSMRDKIILLIGLSGLLCKLQIVVHIMQVVQQVKY